MTKDIINGNRLISNFMDYKFLNKKEYAKEVGCPEYEMDNLPDCNCYYHSSWDWLMPVIHKILFNTDINNKNNVEWEKLIQNIQSSLLNCEITNLYNTVVEFINWYNNNE